jgi:hypothetical protein
MIVTFRSQAAGDVIMFGDVAKRLMEVMGKESSEKGIVTVDQLPDAIARLKAAIAEDKARNAGVGEEKQPEVEAAPGGQRPYVSLAVRAVPLLELLEYSLKEKTPVVWGV